MDKETLIYQYFANELDTKGEARLNELLANDAAFREEFEFERNLQKAIRNQKGEELKAKLGRFENDIVQKETATKPKAGFRNWSIAASIILLIGLGWIGFNQSQGNDTEDLFEEHFRTYPNTVYAITRGDADASLERKAFVAYESGDYESALELFQQLGNDTAREYLDFYKAQSYLNLGNTATALKLFQNVAESNKTFAAEAHWYAALTYLKEGDKEKAVDYLERLIADFDYNRERASKLLEKMD